MPARFVWYVADLAREALENMLRHPPEAQSLEPFHGGQLSFCEKTLHDGCLATCLKGFSVCRQSSNSLVQSLVLCPFSTSRTWNMHFESCVFKVSCRLCLWNLNLWRWRCRLRLENTMATCCRWAELCRAMFLMELLPITLLSLHSMLPIRQNFMFMPPMWRIANFADGKGEDCDGSDIPKNSKRTLLPRYQQMVVFVSFGSFSDLMKMGIRRRFRMPHQGVQPYAYTKTWLRSAIKISGRPP